MKKYNALNTKFNIKWEAYKRKCQIRNKYKNDE